MTTSVSSERAEFAIARINQTLARFDAEGRRPDRGRTFYARRGLVRKRVPPWQSEWSSHRAQDAISRLMSIAEELTLGLLVDVTEQRLPRSALVAKLWEHHAERNTDTWSQRLGVWKDLHGIAVKASFPRYNEPYGFVEARNAIVHGLGSLSPKQLKDRTASVAHLKPVGVVIVGNQLVISAAHVTKCGGVLRDLVAWLDQAASALPAQA